jgi:hypothetical protein
MSITLYLSVSKLSFEESTLVSVYAGGFGSRGRAKKKRRRRC